jgi:hypothetical protein
MTQQRDFKRRVRDRMAKTGESFKAARAQLLAQRDRPPVIAVVEPRDVTGDAITLGLSCTVLATDGFDVGAALRQLRDVLFRIDSEDLAVMRAAVLRGERPMPRGQRWWIEGMREFVERARAGIGGVAPHGCALAYVVDGVMVIAMLSVRGNRPLLWLRAAAGTGADELALAGIRMR